MWAMRISIFFIGALATFIAIVVESVYVLWFLCSDLLYVISFPQLLCVVYLRDTNTYGSVVGFVVGVVLRLTGGEYTLHITPVIKYPWYSESEGLQLFPYKTFAMLVTFTSIVAVSSLTTYVFGRGLLSSKFDIFKCFEGKSECSVELHVSSSSTKYNDNPAYAHSQNQLHGRYQSKREIPEKWILIIPNLILKFKKKNTFIK